MAHFSFQSIFYICDQRGSQSAKKGSNAVIKNFLIFLNSFHFYFVISILVDSLIRLSVK